MLDVVFRPKVPAQIDQISDQTIAEWEEPQAKAYVAEIRRQIERAAEFPGIGSSAYGLPVHYRKVRAGSHRIIYRSTPTALIVVRIILEREDVPDDLDG